MRTMICGDIFAKIFFFEVPLKGSSKSQTERDLSQHSMKTISIFPQTSFVNNILKEIFNDVKLFFLSGSIKLFKNIMKSQFL